MSTTYTLQQNVNNTGWTTVQTKQVNEIYSVSCVASGFSNTDVVQFRMLLSDSYETAQQHDPSSANVNFVTGEWRESTGIQTVLGKSSSAYERQTSFRVSGEAPWIVRCTRLTPDSTSAYVVNKTTFASITSVIEEKFRYPGSVLVGMQVDAEQFSSIPTRSFLCKMAKVKIPSNYNPISRVYSGVWNGSFVTAWTDNPAWCFYDLITNTRYGLGERIPESAVDKWALYSIGQYCDELVPTDDGTYEPRFTCNMLLQTKEQAYQVINDFASIFRGITYWGAGTIVPIQDSPKGASYAFNNTNVVDGQFEYQSSSISTRYNAVSVTWNNPDDYYRQAVEYVEDVDNIASTGFVNQTQVAAFGCASRSMAWRVGKWLLYTNNYQTDVVSFVVGNDGAIPRPGDEIKISDVLRSQERRGGRVKSATLSEVVLDSPTVFTSGVTYTLSAVDVDGSLIENTFSYSGTTDTITFSTPFAKAIAKDSIYIIADDNIEPQLFKVTSISEKEAHQYTIQAVSHEPEKYDAIELGQDISVERLPTQLVYPVTNLVAQEVVYVSGVAYASRLEISWTAATLATNYKVKVVSSDNQIYNFTTKSTSYSLENLPLTTYNIYVSAVNVLNQESQQVETSITLVGKTWKPSDVTSAQFEILESSLVKVLWEPISDIDVVGYEVRRNDTNWGTNDSNRVFLGATNSVTFPPESTSNTYYIRAVDNIGGYSTSSYALVVSVTTPAAPTNITYSYADTSTTASTVTTNWVAPSSEFVISHYVISLTKPDMSVVAVKSNTTSYTFIADWVGPATLSVTAVNIYGWSGTTATSSVIKELPNNVEEVYKQISGRNVVLSWDAAVKTSLPIGGYEIRSSDVNWGGEGCLFKGDATNYTAAVALGINTWYMRSFDTDANYSPTTLVVNYTVDVPVEVSELSYVFADTSTTNATVTLSWNTVATPFGVKHYKISYEDVVITSLSNTVTLQADWIGQRIFSVTTVDSIGSEAAPTLLQVTKLVPGVVTNFRAQTIDNNVLLYWNLPAKTTLPVSHVKIRRGDTWESGIDIGTKSGSFTTIFESQAGTYTYWAVVVDTDSYEGTPAGVTTKVSSPPDYILHGDVTSSFSGDLTNAAFSNNKIVLPVDTEITWQQHFVNNSWGSPQDQVNAGYPIYIQPTVGNGVYQEVFDFGSIFSGTKVTVNLYGVTTAGTCNVNVDIALSDDNVNWDTSYGVTELYGTNFRYVRVSVNVSSPDDKGVYELSTLNVRLDAKLKNDAGKVDCLSTDANGTLVNFNFEYVDVTSLVLSANSTTPITAVYDYTDTVLSGTYSISAGVLTAYIAGHSLSVGQNVRVSFSTGASGSEVFEVATTPYADSFTAVTTRSNSSGNLSIYSQGFKAYLFDSAGTRVSGSASWSVKGY